MIISEELKNILTDSAVLSLSEISADYCKDELPGGKSFPPDTVVEAGSIEDAATVVKFCNQYRIPIIVRGSGTGKAGGSVPVKGGVILSLRKLNKIISIDEAGKRITVEPGVLLQDVKEEAEKHGLYYPPDPGEKTSTIGGNISTNAAGPCAFKHGRSCDYVEDAVLILADGTICRLSDNSQYKNVLGSEGTLAVIVEITLRLVYKPKKDTILLLPFMDSKSCVNAALKLSAPEFNASILEYLDTDMVEFSGEVTGNPVFPINIDGERVGATLMMNIEGEDDDELDEKMEAVAELAEELECLDILVVDTPTLKRDTWAAHDAFHTSTETAKSVDEYNIDLPSEHFAEMVEFCKALGKEKGVKVLCYGHCVSGGLHIHVLSTDPSDDFDAVSEELKAAVYEKLNELGGSLRGEYGIGYAKLAAFKQYCEESKYEDMLELKEAFDPSRILNPGKVVK